MYKHSLLLVLLLTNLKFGEHKELVMVFLVVSHVVADMEAIVSVGIASIIIYISLLGKIEHQGMVHHIMVEDMVKCLAVERLL